MKTVFVNPERCIGCRQCEYACAVEHSRGRDPLTAPFERPRPRTRIHVAPGSTQFSSFPVKCRHCDPAPCHGVCPTGAIYRSDDRELVLVDEQKCIACAMCAMVCPFDALTFHARTDGVPERIVAIKCDGCTGRVEQGREPACAEVCKTGALVFGDLNELVKAGRVREANAVLEAVSAARTEALPAPDNVAAWRTWGRSSAVVKV